MGSKVTDVASRMREAALGRGELAPLSYLKAQVHKAVKAAVGEAYPLP